jgi:hypothetical protein
MKELSKEDCQIVLDEIEKTTLSDSSKFTLRQFLRPIVCGCGSGLVRNGEMLCTATPEMRDHEVKEINDSGIASVSVRTDTTLHDSGLVRYYLGVRFCQDFIARVLSDAKSSTKA